MDFHLDNFDGPLDLLLHLISKNKVSIYDIPIAEILEQYMAVLHEAEHMDLDVAGDFIAMAAQLVYIKSRMLLPKHEEDEAGEDPRAGLVEMLLEYQRLKSATAFFAEKNENGRDIYVKPPERQDDAPVEYHHTVNDLIRAANKMLRRTKRRLPPPVTSFQGIVGREPAPVEGRVTAILKRFLYRMRVPFMRLFDDARNRSEIVATFLAVLELSKTRRIRLEGDGEEMEPCCSRQAMRLPLNGCPRRLRPHRRSCWTRRLHLRTATTSRTAASCCCVSRTSCSWHPGRCTGRMCAA